MAKASHAGTGREPEVNRFYARVANFPKKLDNLRAKIAALGAEAAELGFREEAAHLSAMTVFADCLPKRAPKKVDWTPQEVADLRCYWLQGVSSVEIAKRLGKTPNAICGAARRHGLPIRKHRRAA